MTEALKIQKENNGSVESITLKNNNGSCHGYDNRIFYISNGYVCIMVGLESGYVCFMIEVLVYFTIC